MAWIESHQSLGRHPKLLKLAGLLRVHKAQAIGHLKYLWWWALDYVPKNGDLSAFTSAEISTGAEWPGDAVAFHTALKEAGWIDENGCINDWEEYSDPCYSSRERQRRYRKNKTLHNSNVTRDVTVTPYQSNPTNPILPKNKMVPSAPARKFFQKPTPEEVSQYGAGIGFPLDGKAFFDSYEAKGWMIGKNPMKDWKAAVRTWKNNGYPCKMAKLPSRSVNVHIQPSEQAVQVKCPKCGAMWGKVKADGESDVCTKCTYGPLKAEMKKL